MKAISLWEPWASLVRTGAKKWETRRWGTKYRGLLLICASQGGLKRYELISTINSWEFQGGLAPLVGKPLNLDAARNPVWADVEIEHLNGGMAVAVVKITDCRPTEHLTLEEIGPDMPFGNFTRGRFAWRLELIEAIDPFPVKGTQGFFEVPFDYKA